MMSAHHEEEVSSQGEAGFVNFAKLDVVQKEETADFKSNECVCSAYLLHLHQDYILLTTT